MYAHYDREVDIAWFRFGNRAEVERSDECDWGLIDRDRSGQVVGLEFWRASELLPAVLLEALPYPSEKQVTAS